MSFKYDWSKTTTYSGNLPALPDDMNESKSWRDGDYAERVRCLIIQNESMKTQIDHFLNVLTSAKQSEIDARKIASDVANDDLPLWSVE